MSKPSIFCTTLLISITISAFDGLPKIGTSRSGPHATDGQTWVKYSAHYTEKVSTRDARGTQTNKTTLKEEFRAKDGTLLTVVKENGQAVSGKLWLADGHRFSLDYLKNIATEEGEWPRKHPFVPPDAILGTKTIAGVNCVIYPLHMHDGNGTICADMDDDILGEVEIHSDVGGIHQDYVNELTWIDLNSPVDPSLFRIPDGFTTLAPSTRQH